MFKAKLGALHHTMGRITGSSIFQGYKCSSYGEVSILGKVIFYDSSYSHRFSDIVHICRLASLALWLLLKYLSVEKPPKPANLPWDESQNIGQGYDHVVLILKYLIILLTLVYSRM